MNRALPFSRELSVSAQDTRLHTFEDVPVRDELGLSLGNDTGYP